jgi:hypothetical protein
MISEIIRNQIYIWRKLHFWLAVIFIFSSNLSKTRVYKQTLFVYVERKRIQKNIIYSLESLSKYFFENTLYVVCIIGCREWEDSKVAVHQTLWRAHSRNQETKRRGQ